NVDAKVRESLRRELKIMQSELGFSAVYVTHDQTEAMELADRIAVVKSGRVEQIATPQELYDRPVSRYVADFIGGANLVDGTVISAHENAMVTVQTVFGEAVAQGESFSIGDTVVLLARPERCEVTLEQPEGGNVWRVKLGRRVFYGAHVEVEGEANGVVFRAWIKDGSLPHGTSEAWLRVAPEHMSAIRP
ncbi:MAG: ABC transporter ATP-binding protein, partial [Arthrobacter sp.]